jgi:hypothetical protein
MCFSLLWLFQILVWLVIVCGVVAILRIIVPWILSLLGTAVDGRVMQIINIIIAVVIIVALLWFIYDLIECVGFGPGYPTRRLG